MESTGPHAPVAQLDRALASGAKGLAFESRRAHHGSTAPYGSPIRGFCHGIGRRCRCGAPETGNGPAACLEVRQKVVIFFISLPVFSFGMVGVRAFRRVSLIEKEMPRLGPWGVLSCALSERRQAVFLKQKDFFRQGRSGKGRSCTSSSGAQERPGSSVLDEVFRGGGPYFWAATLEIFFF